MKFVKYCSVLLFSLLICVGIAKAERVVIVGDSITGHSMNLPFGYIHEMRKALADGGADNVEVVPLGGSGQRVDSWSSIVRDSVKQRRQLDIKGIFVKDELDKKVDTLVIFLGMNDALKPSVQLTPESLAKWRTDYQTLIDLLKERTGGYKKLILCPPTMLTESPYSFRNVLMDQLSKELAVVAKKNNAIFCDLRGEFQKHFCNARLLDPGFFFTPDCVHPGQPGHALMTWVLLNAIGQKEIAQKYYLAKIPEKLRDFQSPGMSLFLTAGEKADDIVIHGLLRGRNKNDIKVTVPDGIKLQKIVPEKGDEFTVYLSGHSPVLSANIVVKAGELERTVKLNAPYYIAMPYPGMRFAGPDKFDWEKEATQIDRDVLAGADPFVSKLNGGPVKWKTFYPTSDYTGRTETQSVDFAVHSDVTVYDKAYIVRKVWSPKEQKGTLKIRTNGFSTTVLPKIYLNGVSIYQGALSPRLPQAKAEVGIELKKGLNVLVSRVNHTEWQWAMTLEFVTDTSLSY